jgi:hypothetical protein
MARIQAAVKQPDSALPLTTHYHTAGISCIWPHETLPCRLPLKKNPWPLSSLPAGSDAGWNRPNSSQGYNLVLMLVFVAKSRDKRSGFDPEAQTARLRFPSMSVGPKCYGYHFFHNLTLVRDVSLAGEN